MNMPEGGPKKYQQFHSLNCGGKLLTLDIPRVMGILNITPDSFYDGGKFTDIKAIIRHARNLHRAGADIIDIGGQSTRPGAKPVGPAAELKRVIPVILKIKELLPEAILSIDTYHAPVAKAALAAGASIVNDISGGQIDKQMIKTVAAAGVPYIYSHIKGTPADMHHQSGYKDVTDAVFKYFAKGIQRLEKAGIQDIVLDPGFGFGKKINHNFTLLNHLSAFGLLGKPLMVGVSRKSMIYNTLKIDPQRSLNGTTALHMAALMNGASIIRAHDAGAAKEVVQLFLRMRS